MSSRKVATSLLQKLSPPSKIASSLDWRKAAGGAVLTLNIHTDRIGLRLAHHPSLGEPSESLDDLPLGCKSHIDDSTRQHLSNLVQEHNVCGLVVSWPVQHDTGKLGYAAGRALWTLEQLVNDNHHASSALKNRPVCLWDGQHVQLSNQRADMWGRNPEYANTPQDEEHKHKHSASVEQYHEDENVVAAQVWNDFCQSQWPGLLCPPSSSNVEDDNNSNNNNTQYQEDNEECSLQMAA